MQLRQVAPSSAGYSLVLHGGAGSRTEELSLRSEGQYSNGLSDAHRAGEEILAAGGSALDAVCAAVEQLENNPLFNSGCGAALTSSGEAELDASVMTGDGRAGAVAASRFARNPVFLARRVMEESEHVFLVAPGEDLLIEWGLESVDPDYFITEARQAQLQRVRSKQVTGARHGTVGAAALDRQGHVAAATSTGGMVNQSMGRVGDTPIIGAGNYARDGVAAISCTGEGEAFIQGVVAHDISARLRYLGSSLAEAVTATIATELDSRGASGGVIAVGADGSLVVAHNSPAMFSAYRDGDRLVTTT